MTTIVDIDELVGHPKADDWIVDSYTRSLARLFLRPSRIEGILVECECCIEIKCLPTFRGRLILRYASDEEVWLLETGDGRVAIRSKSKPTVKVQQ